VKLKARFSLLIVVILMMLTLSACGTGAGGRATPTPVPQIVSYEKSVFTVERGPIVSVKNIMGEIVPSKQDELFFRASGFVTRVAVKQGDLIKKGDVLAEMQVEDMVNQLQQAQIDLEVAQASLAKSKAQREFDLQRAQADVIIQQARVELARLDVSQSSGSGRVRAELNLQIAEQSLLLAEETLKLTKNDVDVYMEQAVKRSELAVERLERMLEERQILAPYDGIVLRTAIRNAQQVDAYYVAIVVGDPTDLVVRSPYDYEMGLTLTENSDINFFLNLEATQSYPVKFMPNFMAITATEEKTTAQLTASNYFYFTVPAELTRDQLKIGKTAKLMVTIGKKDDVLLLPPAAIREYKGLQFVIVQNGESRRRVEINEVGLKTPDKWEVVAELQEGDQVVGP
jgi:HlyD family secretion protein